MVGHRGGERWLELNEGQAVHSVYRPGTVLTDGYWDEMLVLPFALRSAPPRRIAILGNAGGTTARAYSHYFPETRVDAVEIDGELTDIAHRWFDLERRPQLRTFAEDARPYLRRTNERYDLIMLDSYRQPYIPFYLATREFFALARDRLAPGGMIAINIGHPETSQRLEQALSATMGSELAHLARDPVQATSTVLVGARARPDAAALRRAAAAPTFPPDLRPLALATAARLAPPLRGGAVYTDDRAPVEWLIDQSIVSYAAGE